MEELEKEDGMWREKTILLLDNATYHRSQFLFQKYGALKIPIMFLGPYQFQLAPVEKFFSFIKGKDLNKEGYLVSSR